MDTSYLSQQVTSIISQLHNLFDEIGVPHHDRDSRESELFSSLSETLHSHLRHVSSEKNDMVQQAQRLITTISQMEASLEDKSPGNLYADDRNGLSVSYPLNECLQSLKEKHRAIGKLHQERYEQVKKLIQALESYSSHLEPAFLQVKLPPSFQDGIVPPTFDLSPSYINSVDLEFSRVFEEYTRRVSAVQQIAEEIIKLWAELGTPQAQTDATIVHCWQDSPEQLGLHKDDLDKLKSRRHRLLEDKHARERRLQDLRTTVEELWVRLSVEEQDRSTFLARNRGYGLRAINDFEDELSRLNELKKQKIHLFVEDARSRLHTLWDELYFSEDEAVEFTPMFCDVYSDALLSAHEAEIARLETLRDQRGPIIQMIAKHRSIVKDRDDLASSSQDGSRLLAKGPKGEKRDPTRLLREEKMRKRIARELPKVEQDLMQILEQFEDEYGRPFLVFGERYMDVIQAMNARALPPRSKTPNGMAPPKMAKSAPHASKPAPSRDVSTFSTSSTLRSKTPAENGTHRAALSTSRIGNSQNKSPSRIPARAPLGNMPHGGNSPERGHVGLSQLARDKENPAHSARGKMGPPLLAPPPKMRDLFQAPSSATKTPSMANYDDESRSGSVVRNVAPEDPYYSVEAVHGQDSRLRSSAYDSHQAHQSHTLQHMPPPPRPAQKGNERQLQETAHNYPSSVDRSTISSINTASSRQLSSNSSTADSTTTASSHTTVASGSENWETFGESDDEDVTPAPRSGCKRAFEESQARGCRNGQTIKPTSASRKVEYASKKLRPGLQSPAIDRADGYLLGARSLDDGRDMNWANNGGH